MEEGTENPTPAKCHSMHLKSFELLYMVIVHLVTSRPLISRLGRKFLDSILICLNSPVSGKIQHSRSKK